MNLKIDKKKIKLCLVAFYKRQGINPYNPDHSNAVIAMLDRAYDSLILNGLVPPFLRLQFRMAAELELQKANNIADMEGRIEWAEKQNQQSTQS